MAPKRNKGEKLSLRDFLSSSNWADEMEDMPITPLIEKKEIQPNTHNRDYNDKSCGRNLDSSYKHDYSFNHELIPLPKEPPYTAHVGNLSFNITESELTNFFGKHFITNIRLMRDRLDDRPKGFGYVEFTDLQALINAISLNGKTLSGRAIKISVAEPPKKGYTDRDPVEDRTAGEWRRTSPLPLYEPIHEKRSTYERSYFGNNDKTYGVDNNPRDFSNWERKGPLQDLPELDSSMNKHDYRNFDGRNGDKYKHNGLGNRHHGNNNNFNHIGISSIGERPKLILKPRGETVEEPISAPKTSTKPNPFGEARPIDSYARFREIEEKEQKRKEIRQAAEDQKMVWREKNSKDTYWFDKKEKNRKQLSSNYNKHSKIQPVDSKSINLVTAPEIETDMDGWSTVNKLSKKR